MWRERRSQATKFRSGAKIHLTDIIVALSPRILLPDWVLLAANSHVNNVARLQVSVPLGDLRWVKGHYLNAECTVQSAVAGNPADARITSIVVNGRSVGEDVLRWQYGSWSLHRYISDWSDERNLQTFEIGDGKVILETKSTEGSE